MKLRRVLLAVALIALHAWLISILAGGGADPFDGGGGASADAGQTVHNFPDARDLPPAGWTGPVFHLSQSYPQSLPASGDEPWLQYDFRTQTVDYLRAILAYALDGNVAVAFQGQSNALRTWYHAPWLHANPRKGREFIHGLTRERDSPAQSLAPTQTRPAETWAVSMYNPPGGYVLGQVWENRDAPDPTKARFPVGTVAFKLIFTTASVAEVPLLKNDLEWQADINRATDAGPRPTLRLLQVDVAVRDNRADATTGWVFGTFVYDGNAPGAAVWDRLIPLGAMWGNDPQQLGTHGPLRETVVNPAARGLVQHLGYEGRLNGPIDNPTSSCLSCHSMGQVAPDLSQPTLPAVPPAGASPATIAHYFRNIPAGTPFTAGDESLDYSLQLQNGIANWAQATGVKFPPPAGPRGLEPRKLTPSEGVRITPIGR